MNELADGRGDLVFIWRRSKRLAGIVRAAMEWLATSSEMGFKMSDSAGDSVFAALKEEPSFPAIAARLTTNTSPVTASRPFAMLAPSDLIDDVTSCFYISSVHLARSFR